MTSLKVDLRESYLRVQSHLFLTKSNHSQSGKQRIAE